MIDWGRVNGNRTEGLSPMHYFLTALVGLVAAVGLISTGVSVAFGVILLPLVALNACNGWRRYQGKKVWTEWRRRRP